MIHLTPLEQTVSGQQLVQIGRVEGKVEGKEEGILIGQILAWQQFTKENLFQEEPLKNMTLEELKHIVNEFCNSTFKRS